MTGTSAVHLVALLIGAFAVVVLALAVFLPQSAAARHRSESEPEKRAKVSSLAERVPISEIRDGLIVRRDAMLWITAPVPVPPTLLVFTLGVIVVISIRNLVVHAPTQF